MRFLFCVLSFLTCMGASRVVVVVGDNPAAVGGMQAELERALPSDVLGAAAVANTEAITALEVTEAFRRIEMEVGALLEDAKDAYYRDRTSAALDALAQIEALYERTDRVPTTARVRLTLWRSAVFEAAGELDKARAEARSALVLDPDLEVDVKEFRPSVVDVVSWVRDRGVKTYKLTFTTRPKTATVTIDDEPLTESVAEGTHWITVRAPGYQEITNRLVIHQNRTLHVSLPLELGDMGSSLDVLVWDEKIPPESATWKRRLNVDEMLVVSLRADQMRAALLKLGSAKATWTEPLSQAAGVQRIVEWAAPKESPTELSRTRWLGHIGPTTDIRIRSARSVGSGGYDVAFLGIGVRGRVVAARGPVLYSGTLTFHSYDLSSASTTILSDTTNEVTGGNRVSGEVGVQYRFNLNPSWYLSLDVGAAFSALQARDFEEGGLQLNMLTSHSLFYLPMRFGWGTRFNLKGNTVHLLMRLGLGGFPRWNESLVGQLGDGPDSSSFPLVSVAAAYRFGDKWSARLHGSYARPNARFSGFATGPPQAPFRDQLVVEQYTTIGLLLSYRFNG